MRYMIVDDEPIARRTLRELCAREPGLVLVGEHGDARSALAAARRDPPDLMFLDIQMDGMTGLQLARELPREKPPLIVFVTAYDQHAVEAFELNAIDYLLKPFDDARLHATLERVRRLQSTQDASQRIEALTVLLERLGQRSPEPLAPARLLGELGGRMHMLDVAEIEWIEADRNYVVLRVGTDQYHARSTLAAAESALASQPVLRISRSCLLNVRHLVEISRTPRGDFIFVTRSGTTLTSSEGYREAVRDYLERFRLGAAPRESPA